MYTASKYNVFLESDNNYLILYNSLSRKIFKLYPEQSSLVHTAIEHPNLEDNGYRNKLIENGFIVKDELDELEYANLMFLQDIFDSRLELIIMPTEQCNFRCKYCYEDLKKGRMDAELIDAICKYVKKNIRNHTSMSVSWFGGEPSEALDIIESLSNNFISYCSKRMISYSAGITTNGYNLTLDALEVLLKCRVYTIQVTVDGIKTTHDRFKVLADGSPTFDVVMNNLRNIRDKCTKRIIDIVIRTNVSKEMLEYMDEIIHFYHQEFGNDPRFSFFFRPVGDWGGTAVKNVCSSVFQPHEFNQVYNKLLDSKLKLNYKLYHSELTKAMDICYANRNNSFVIGSDGTIYKCTNKFDYDINQVGKLYKDGKMELDKNKISKWTLAGLKTSKKCESCKMLPACHAATCIADQVKGSKNEPTCPHMKGSLPTLLKLLSKDERYIPFL